MRDRLNGVESPSSSKEGEEEDYGMEMEEGLQEEDISSEPSNFSIPMAHREYEKTLRQLEAECRTHIKCE
jgi:hypothetical protein